MNLEKRVEQLELKTGGDQPVQWDIILVALVPDDQTREVIGMRESRSGRHWVRGTAESIEDFRQRVSLEADRSSGPAVMFSEEYATS